VDGPPEIAPLVPFLSVSLLRSTIAIASQRMNAVPFSANGPDHILLSNLTSFQVASQDELDANFTAFLSGSPNLRHLSIISRGVEQLNSTSIRLGLASLSIHVLRQHAGIIPFLHGVLRGSSQLQNLEVVLLSKSISGTSMKVSSLIPEGVAFTELKALSLGGRGFSREEDEDSFPKLSGLFPSLRTLVVSIPRSKALDRRSSGCWSSIQKLCVNYDYEREDEGLEEGILYCIPAVREVYISGISLVSLATVCKTIGSLQTTAITVLSLRFASVTSIDNFDFASLGVAVAALTYLEELSLIGGAKLPVRAPLWRCNFTNLASTLSPLRHLQHVHFNPSVIPTNVHEGLLQLAPIEGRHTILNIVNEHKNAYHEGTLRLAEACVGLQRVTWGIWRQMFVWDAVVVRDGAGALLRLDFDTELRML